MQLGVSRRMLSVNQSIILYYAKKAAHEKIQHTIKAHNKKRQISKQKNQTKTKMPYIYLAKQAKHESTSVKTRDRRFII